MFNEKQIRQLQIIASILIWVPLIIFLFIPNIVSNFINVNEYIDNSIEVKVNDVEYIDRDYLSAGARSSRYVIKSNTTYYELLFYYKNKFSYPGSDFNPKYIPKTIIVDINPIELEKHTGSELDPIPVLNFSIEPNKKVWDDETYHFNVKSYKVYEDIMHLDVYVSILWYMMGLGGLVFVVLLPSDIKRKRKAVREYREEKRKKTNTNDN